MERTVVIYKSKYGATQKYAQWIGEELCCPVFGIDDFSKARLADYDNIIYGGGVQAGGIKEFDRFKKWIKPLVGQPEKKIVVFAVALFAVCSMIYDFSQTKCVWLRVKGRLGGER